MAEFYSLSMAVEEVKEKGFGTHQVKHKHNIYGLPCRKSPIK